MKLLLSVLLFLPGLGLAQQIAVEQIPANDMLRYAGMDPNQVNSIKFSVTLPPEKYAAFEWQVTEDGKALPQQRSVIPAPMGPRIIYGLKVVVLPYNRERTVRMVAYKFSDDAGSYGGQMPVYFPDSTAFNELEMAARIPNVLKYTVGSKIYSIRLLTSDSSIPGN